MKTRTKTKRKAIVVLRHNGKKLFSVPEADYWYWELLVRKICGGVGVSPETMNALDTSRRIIPSAKHWPLPAWFQDKVP